MKTEGRDRLWLGLVLVDPPISSSYALRRPDNEISSILTLQTRLFQGGALDFLSGPSFSDNIDPETGPTWPSPLESLNLYWGIEQPQGFDVNCPTLFSLSSYPLRIIAAEWMTYSELMYHSIKQYEYTPNNAVAALRQIAILNADIYWTRRCMATAHKIRYVIDFLRYRVTKDGDKEHSALLTEDNEQIWFSIDTFLQTRAVEIAGVVVGGRMIRKTNVHRGVDTAK